MLISSSIHPASPSIFISSTVSEFRDLRSALAYILRSNGFRVYLSEESDFNVRGDRSAFEECFENIRASDYYILLIGGKRGNLYEDGVSITRQEYRIAREQLLSSNRPRLHLYLRKYVEDALSGNEEARERAGIDDIDHLASFIKEVRQPKIESAPNYLKHFDDFEDVIVSVTNWLNIGKTFSETLLRYSLLAEILFNLSHLVSKIKGTVYPNHEYIARARREISITPQHIGQRISLPDDHVVSLTFMLTGRKPSSVLRSRIMGESLDQGIFLTFNSAKGVLEESPLHIALRQNLEDIQALRALDSPSALPQWDTELLQSIKLRWQGRPRSMEVDSYSLAQAFVYHDRASNVFNGHIALCKQLLGLTPKLESFERKPLTPFGKEEEQKIQAEHVSVEEIKLLIQNNVAPFGTRLPREVFGKTREEQIQRVSDIMSKQLKDIGLNIDSIHEVIKIAAQAFLDKDTAPPLGELEKP